MIVSTFTPKLEYVGAEIPARLAIRPYAEVSPRIDTFRDVRWRRDGPTVSVEPLGEGAGAATAWLDAWERGAVLYSHFLFDLWPKLALAREKGLKWDRVLVNSAVSRFAREGLRALDIDRSVVTPMAKGGVELTARELWRIEGVRSQGFTPPWVVEAVRGAFQPEPTGRGRKLYISRAGAARRRVLGEEALIAALEAKGFEAVRLESLSIRQTAELMGEAEVVVAPHGAGLANLVFCRPPCRVIEFFGWHVSQEFWLLAEAVGLDYVCLEGRGPDGRSHAQLEPNEAADWLLRNTADIQVDVAAVLALI